MTDFDPFADFDFDGPDDWSGGPGHNNVGPLREDDPFKDMMAKFWTGSSEDGAKTSLQSLASRKFAQIARQAPSSGAKNALRLEKKLNIKAQNISPGHHQIVVLDPDLFSIGTFMVLPASSITHYFLESRGFSVKEVSLHYDYQPSQDKVELNNGGIIHYLAPYDDHTLNDIDADRAIVATQTNLHEFYHIIDPVFMPEYGTRLVYTPQPETLQPGSQEIENLIGTLQAETLADTASLLDMLRQGYPLKLLDTFIRFRLSSSDIGHCTAKGLQSFKAAVKKLGLKQLRQLDDKSALAFCIDHVKNNSPTKEQIYLASQIYLSNTGKSEIDHALLNTGKPDLEAGEFYAKYLKEPKKPMDLNFVAAMEILPKVDEEISEEEIALRHKAFAMQGVITPETMAMAFIATLEEFRKRGNADPEINALSKTIGKNVYYVAENLARGVNIFDYIPQEDWPNMQYFDPKHLPAIRL